MSASLLGGAALGGRGEQFFEPGLGLPLPAADLIRMNLVLGRDRLDRAVPAERLQRYPGLELCCESASFRRHPIGHLNLLSGTTSIVSTRLSVFTDL